MARHTSHRAKIRGIEASIDKELMKKQKAIETLKKLRLEKKIAKENK